MIISFNEGKSFTKIQQAFMKKVLARDILQHNKVSLWQTHIQYYFREKTRSISTKPRIKKGGIGNTRTASDLLFLILFTLLGPHVSNSFCTLTTLRFHLQACHLMRKTTGTKLASTHCLFLTSSPFCFCQPYMIILSQVCQESWVWFWVYDSGFLDIRIVFTKSIS